METLFQHLRYGLRTLARTPGFSSIVILVMALGIGATVSMFTVVHSVVMMPLPFHEQGRLVRIYEADSHDPTQNRIAVSGLDFFDWRQQQKHSFEQMAIAYNSNSYNISSTAGQLPEHVMALTASWNIFPMLGVEPALDEGHETRDLGFVVLSGRAGNYLDLHAVLQSARGAPVCDAPKLFAL